MIRQFLTDDNLVVPAVSREKMEQIDFLATTATGLQLVQMMENAGRSLAELSLQLMGSGALKTRILVLAGGGNNGCGGICAARHLHNRGLTVAVWQATPPATPACEQQWRIYQAAGGEQLGESQLHNFRPRLIIDALIGYRLQGEPRWHLQSVLEWASQHRAFKLALDVPTGVDATTGETPGNYLRADATLTLALPKSGLLPHLAGNLFLADIGIPPAVFQKAGITYQSPFAGRFVVPLLPFPEP